MGMKIDIRERTLIALPVGELDHLQAERLRVQIDTAFDRSVCKNILLDMQGVSFMDSSGIGMIIGRYKNAEKRGGKLALANMSDTVSRLFELSGLAKIILRAKTVDEALLTLGTTSAPLTLGGGQRA